MAGNRIVLHHLNNSKSMTVLRLLEELKVDYDIQLHERLSTGTQAGKSPETLKQVHPLAKSPTLITPTGRVLFESGAIMNYLLETYDTSKQFQGNPATGNDSIRNDVLTDYGNSTLNLVMIVEMLFQMVSIRSPFIVRPILRGAASMVHRAFTGPDLEAGFKFLEKELGDQDYFMGANPGRADFMLGWNLDFCTHNNFVDLKNYPKLEQYYARCKAREAWKRALNRGGEYNLKFS